jgi:hypothetical protein
MIKRALAQKHFRDAFFTEVNTGSAYGDRGTIGRFDAIAIEKSYVHSCISGYEIKVARSDFRGDTKWDRYLPLCNRFSFACPAGLIQPEELPAEVGLVYYNPDTQALHTKRKAAFRPIDPPVPVLMSIIVNRVDNDKRHPFFSNAREACEAYAGDKDDRRELGLRVRTKLVQEVEQLRGRAAALEGQLERAKSDASGLEGYREAMAELGIHGWRDEQRIEELRRLVTGAAGMSPAMQQRLRTIRDTLPRLLGDVDAILEETRKAASA